ncbi:MAG: hypothetical protein P8K79_07660 [Mariniblastus sp.]|nr:hypothetical protein [Mariniblastus sp.]
MSSNTSKMRLGSGARTKVSHYDTLNAMLISAIVVVGFLVTLLFLIWLTMVLDFSRRQPAMLVAYEEPFGNEKPEGFEDDIYEPGVEEFPEVETPQLKDALEAVTEAVSSVRANLEARDGDAAEMGRGAGFGSRDGGPGTGNADVIPEHKRWKIDYESNNISEYAKQLSFFDIDIGTVQQNTNGIVRLRDVGGNPQTISTDRKAEKKTLYFSHEKRRMRRWDETLVKNNGIDLEGSFTVQFYPMKTRVLLRQVEQAYLTEVGRTLRDVRRTYFKVVPSAGGFEFKLTDMNFRL